MFHEKIAKHLNKTPDEIMRLIDFLTEEERKTIATLLRLEDPALYYNDPIGFSYFVLGIKVLTKGQKEIMTSVQNNKFTLVKAANAVGKGYSAGIIGLWFYINPVETKVILTAPPAGNHRQLKLVWGEVERHINRFDPKLNKVVQRRDLLNGGRTGYLQITKIGSPNRHFFKAYTVPTQGKPSERKAKFSGEHAERIMYIVDECDAVFSQYPEIWEGLQTCMAGGHARFLGLFNPRSQGGPVWDMEKTGLANVIELSAFEHPNVIYGPQGKNEDGSDIELVPGAVTRQVTVDNVVNWSIPVNREEARQIVEQLKKDIKPSNEFFQVPECLHNTVDTGDRVRLKGGKWRKVIKPALYHVTLARYGLMGEKQLIANEWIDKARDRQKVYVRAYGHEPPEGIRPIIGLDIADQGSDTNTLCPRYGGFIPDIPTWKGIDPNSSAKVGFRYSIDYNASVVNCDGIGVGAGVPNRMIELLQEHNEQLVRENKEPITIKIQKIMVSEKPMSDPVVDNVVIGRFRSLRDELLWHTMIWVRDDPTAMLPMDDEELAEEGAAFEWYSIGKEIVVSSTKDVRKKIGRSPDKWMSLANTFYRYRSFVVA